MRKYLIAMVAAAGMVGVGLVTPAEAATGKHVTHVTCTIPKTKFTFRYDINWTASGADLAAINSIKVTDAQGHHYVRSLSYGLYRQSTPKKGGGYILGTRYDGKTVTWAKRFTKFPRVNTSGSPQMVDVKYPTVVRVSLVAYTDRGTPTPSCTKDTAIYY